MNSSILGLLLAAVAVQTPSASVVGSVRDAATGEPVPGAEVTLTDLERGVVTDAAGRFELLEVPAGPQHLTVGRIGYATTTAHALVPVRGELEVNFSLPVEPVEVAAIDVRPRVDVRGMDPGERGIADRRISQRTMRVHPMLAEPDAFQALAGGDVVMDPEAPTGVHLRGGRSDQTAYLLDGIPVFSPYHGAGLFSAWNPDALAGLEVFSSVPPPAFPAALSGTISASTRRPGSELRGQGAVSTSQWRFTVDGPAGAFGGYLLSLRAGLPDLFAPAGEPEYIRGETGDHVAKLDMTLLGGQLGVLSYGSESELGTAGSVGEAREPGSPGGALDDGRNHFEWRSHSYGATWTRALGSSAIRARVWNAWSDAASAWDLEASRHDLSASRTDRGLLVAYETSATDPSPDHGRIEVGFRLERSRTSYAVASRVGEGDFGLTTSTPVAALFGSVSTPVAPDIRVELGSTLGTAAGTGFFGPRGQIQWTLAEGLAVSANYSRSHQFAQSLRSAESLAGYVFPADLYVGSGHESVPVARGDLGVVGVDWSPSAALRVGVQGFSRAMHGLMLVSSTERGPFSKGSFDVGSGSVRGLSVETSVSGAQYGLLASYGWQTVRLNGGGSEYAPSYGTEHLFDAGAVLFPTATSLVRISASAALGRRTSPSSGTFEWEACNLLDRGCEFLGTPHLADRPGALALPAYVRVDLGARKHWHLEVGGRDASVAVFGTLTNLLGRRNVLTEVVDPATGERRSANMRPRSPLVVGIDWRF